MAVIMNYSELKHMKSLVYDITLSWTSSDDLSLKKTNFFTGKTFYTSTIKTYCPKGFYLNGHMQMVFVHRVNTSWEIAELTKQIFISNDMDTEISDRLKYFDNLCNGNNLQVRVNAMMCSKLTELLEVTVHCR